MFEAPLSNLSPSLYVAIVVPTSIALGLLLSFLTGFVVRRFARKTKTVLDDILVENIGLPISVSVTVYGLWLSLHIYKPSLAVEYVGEGLLLTVLLVVWTFGAVRGMRQFLEWLAGHQERLSMVNGRTLPTFDMFGRIMLFGGLVYFLFLAWDIDVTGWLASAGILGVAVGFAAQETLSNLIAGMFILADAPYKLGDYLVLDSGQTGVVTEIGFRTTRLQTRDDVEVVVPNGIMANAVIANESGGPSHKTRVNLPIGVAYGSDVDVVRQILMDVPRGVAGVAERPAPIAHFESFGASSLDFTLRVWLTHPKRRPAVVDQVNTGIYKALMAAGVEIPYSKHDVYLHRVGEDSAGAG